MKKVNRAFFHFFSFLSLVTSSLYLLPSGSLNDVSQSVTSISFLVLLIRVWLYYYVQYFQIYFSDFLPCIARLMDLARVVLVLPVRSILSVMHFMMLLCSISVIHCHYYANVLELACGCGCVCGFTICVGSLELRHKSVQGWRVNIFFLFMMNRSC